MSKKRVLTVGTRTSRLALWQTNHIIEQLQAAWPGLECRIHEFVTKGDKTLHKPLPQIGGKGLFTAELERALHQQEIDIAVHSLKDLPVANAPGLTLGAITSRAPVHDGLVARNGRTLATLPPGAVVGTSSMRRRAQLLIARPDLNVESIRGNVGTRVGKVLEGQYDAAVLAAAGLQRLHLEEDVAEWLPLDVMLPAPGQGALAVQCRAADEETLALLAMIDDAQVRAAVTAERTFLERLGGGCSAPIAAYAYSVDENALQMRALVASPDGKQVVGVEGTGEDGEQLGTALAQQALARGAGQILATLLAAQPLKEKRIVITRSPTQARAFSEKLVALAAIPIVLPAIRIEPMPDMAPLDRAIRSLGRYDWVIFTSTNGVTQFWQRLTTAGLDASAFNGVKVAAVGSATADSLVAHGIKVDLVPQKFVAEQLAAGLGDLSGQKVLLPVAELARSTLTDMLQEQGAAIERINIYQTLPARLTAAELAELERGIGAITFTSSSTVRNFVTAVGAAEDGRYLPIIHNTTIACIGPKTAATARELGLDPTVVAAEHTIDGLIQALVDHFQKVILKEATSPPQ